MTVADRSGEAVEPFGVVVPRPVEVAVGPGALLLTPDVRVVAGGAPAAEAASRLALDVARLTGGDPAVTDESPGTGPTITLGPAGAGWDLGDEGYRLTVDPAGVAITAVTAAGFAWAGQTLVQVLRRSVEVDGRALLPVGAVRDRPRFAWRGLMLDVARHFFPVEDVCHVVDLAAALKLNRLHLHLTDDQGWRLEVRSHPALTAVGGRSQVGGGPGGWYTQDDYRRIVDHAGAAGVVVVPEIDVPGHTNAALHALPLLAGDRPVPGPRTDTAVGYSTLDVEAEATYAWLDDVIGEVAAVTPGPWIHLGGDESHRTDREGYRRFVTRATAIVRAHGKVPVGWEEIGSAPLGGPAVVQHWFDPARVAPGVEQGASVVASPANRAYLDMKTDASTPLGLDWAGYVDTRTAYEWDPAGQVPGLPEERLLGIEAALWSETVTARAHIEQMLLPRLAALAEVAWTPQGDRRFDDLAARLATHRRWWQEDGTSVTADPSLGW